VSGCFVSETSFHLIGCSDGTSAATEGTASRIALDVDVDSGAGVRGGDSA
jgi:hypothetical protein